MAKLPNLISKKNERNVFRSQGYVVLYSSEKYRDFVRAVHYALRHGWHFEECFVRFVEIDRQQNHIQTIHSVFVMFIKPISNNNKK